jgi:acyl-coenzyme A synthetase/AMP-(fatty) acid ligase
MGTIDYEGYITIFDRIKEMITFDESQAIPSKLEALLLDHPGIQDAAVVGQWDEEQATEVPSAFVVLKDQNLVD